MTSGCLGLSEVFDDTEDPEPLTLEPGTYDCIVIMRNDDPAPQHAIEELNAVEAIFLEERVPVTHGIIPAMEGVTLDDNPDFCERLVDRMASHPGYFEMSMHGYTHAAETDFVSESELGGLPRAEQRERIDAGIDALESCTETPVETFIPPFNTYDTTTVEELVDAGIEIISGGQWFTRDYFDTEDLPFERHGALHIPNTHAFVSDWQTGEFYSLSAMIEAFDAYRADHDLYVQMLHFQYFTNQERLDQLQSLIQHMKATAGVGFMTLEAFGNAYLQDEIVRTEGGWVYDPT